jgi:hypothetical protein
MLKLFTVHDKVSNTHLKPFSFTTVRDALDGFKVVCNEKDTPYNLHPEDFELCEIGTYDPRTGLIDPHTSPEVVAQAKDLIQ